jgi:hypothetical protein
MLWARKVLISKHIQTLRTLSKRTNKGGYLDSQLLVKVVHGIELGVAHAAFVQPIQGPFGTAFDKPGYVATLTAFDNGVILESFSGVFRTEYDDIECGIAMRTDVE